MNIHTNHIRNGSNHGNTTHKNGSGYGNNSSAIDRGAEERARLIGSGIEFFDDSYRLLEPVLDESTSSVKRLMRTAATIARDRDGAVLALSLATLPDQTPLGGLSDNDPPVREAHNAVEQLLQAAVEVSVPAEGIVCLTHREARSILSMAEKYECDGILLTTRQDHSQRQRLLSGNTIEKIIARAEADVSVEKPGPTSSPIRRILLAASGGPHSGIAAETARAVALATDARVDIVHFLDDDPNESTRQETKQILRAATHVLNDVENVETEIANTKDVAEALIDRSDRYDVTVLGTPTKGLLFQFVLGTVPDSVKRQSETAVLMTKQNTGNTSIYYRWIVGDETEGR